MSEIEAAGEIVTAGLVGRAVEPVADGEGGERVPGPGECLNCGNTLKGDFCDHCGQKVHLHRTLGGMIHDIVHGVLHLDGKFWNTLPLLVWKPGELTRRYIAGQRARFISPIAFYLFTVVAMFALVVSIGELENADFAGVGDAPAETVEEQRERIAQLERTLEEMAEEDFPGVEGARVGVEASLTTAQRQLEEMEEGTRVLAETEGGARVTTNFAAQEDGFFAGINDAISDIQDNPALFLYKVQTTSYKLSWLLIPMSLPFMWLLFPFSKRVRMYDHAVFVTYSISFMMLMVIIAGLLARIGLGELAGVVAVLYAPVHLYKQLKGTYGLGRWSALARTVALSIIAWIVLALFIALMLALGALN